MHFKSILAVLALTAASAVFAAPAPTDKYPPMQCSNGYDPKENKCCDYGYDEHVGTPSSMAYDDPDSFMFLDSDQGIEQVLQAQARGTKAMQGRQAPQDRRML
jgi:hypothetical protein